MVILPEPLYFTIILLSIMSSAGDASRYRGYTPMIAHRWYAFPSGKIYSPVLFTLTKSLHDIQRQMINGKLLKIHASGENI